MANCETIIAGDVDINCEAPIQQGLEANAVIINKSQIDIAKYSTTKKNMVESITLTGTNRGYSCYVPGQTPYTGIQTTLVAGTYRNKWDKNIPVVILDNGPEVAENVLDGLANGTFVMITENKYKGSDDEAAFQIYGLEQGLVASAGNDGKYDDALDGGWSVTLTETGAPKSAIFLYAGSYAATKAMVQSLVASV